MVFLYVGNFSQAFQFCEGNLKRSGSPSQSVTLHAPSLQGAARGANTCAPLRAVLVHNICALLQHQSYPAGPGRPSSQLASRGPFAPTPKPPGSTLPR